MDINDMDVNDIDSLLHEIQQMCLVAVRAHESLVASDTAPGFFQMPSEDAELLSFGVYDLVKRIKALRTALYPLPSTVLSIVRDN
jgi:hypothetical protein